MTQRTHLIVYRPDDLTLEAALEALRGPVAEAAVDSTSASDVRLDTLVEGPMTLNTRSDQGNLSGMLSFGAYATTPELRGVQDAITAAGLRVHRYETTQDVPRDYEHTWGEGVSPGVRQLTFLMRKPGMTYDAFREHWFGTHGPLALKIHPIWRYDRNAVVEHDDGAPPFEGIVGLHFRELEDVTEPLRLYGGDFANAQVIAQDVASFINMKTIVVSVMREKILRSA